MPESDALGHLSSGRGPEVLAIVIEILLAADATQVTWTWIPLVAAAVAGVFALAGIFTNLAASRRDRRRELYADAYKTALAMVEMVYRLRGAGPDNLRDLADHFHQIHEEINFHQGWIETESPEMGRAYRRLILSIRAETREPINEGWKALRELPTDKSIARLGVVSGDHPDVTAAKRQFLADVSAHLSWTRRDELRDRYSDYEWRRIRAGLRDGGGGTFYDPPAQ
jgi:hypothetical protein